MVARPVLPILVAVLVLPAAGGAATDGCFEQPTAACLVDRAVEGARTLRLPEERTSALMEIAVLQGEAGDVVGARTTFATAVTESRQVEKLEARATLLCGIAMRQAAAGDRTAAGQVFADAVALIEGRMATGYDQSFSAATRALRTCATAQAAGDPDAAAALLQRLARRLDGIGDPGVRHTEMILAAMAQSEIGDLGGAGATLLATRDFAMLLPPGDDRFSLLIAIVSEQNRLGLADSARMTMSIIVQDYREIADPAEQQELKLPIAVQLLKQIQQ